METGAAAAALVEYWKVAQQTVPLAVWWPFGGRVPDSGRDFSIVKSPQP
jgi:hypothetical protein